MSTAAEDYLFESDPKINLIRDHLVAICAALSSARSMDARQTTALYRLADIALDEVDALERHFTTAFEETFRNNSVKPN